MNINFFKKPEFYFHPKLIFSRLKKKGDYNNLKAKTAWGGEIYIDNSETIGSEIFKTGVYDLALTEVLCRLIQPGDFVLDIGANIGYASLLSSIRAGNNGNVWSFEPNPLLMEKLNANIKLAKHANIKLFPFALSDSDKRGYLAFPDIYRQNEGTAYVGMEKNARTFDIDLKKLDNLLPEKRIVNVLKIDVEGHELQVLKGSQKILKNKRIINIVYEDFDEYPSKVANLLMEYGYTIFRLEKGWFNLNLRNPDSISNISRWDPTNYLATLNQPFVREKMKGIFYKCL